MLLRGGIEKTCYRTLLKLKRKVPAGIIDGFESLLAKFDNIKSSSPNGSPSRTKVLPVLKGNSHFVTLELRDLHCGRQHWQDERLWSLEKWSRVCRNAVIDTVNLILRVGGIERVMLVCGDDLLHYDNDSVTTTGGTRVEGFASIPRIVDTACEFLVWAVQYLLENLGPVEYIHTCGNHDRLLGWLCARSLQAWFRNTPDVTIDADRSPRKARLWRSILLCWEHGDYLPPSRLASVIPNIYPELWGRSKYRVVVLGHYHKSKIIRPLLEYSDKIVIRYVPSIAPPDGYHYDRGWVGQEAMESFIYNDVGLVGSFVVRARD